MLRARVSWGFRVSGYKASIDFGTSYTVAASQSQPHTAPVVVPLVDEGRLSSAVALDDSGALQAGPIVEQVAALTPDRVERTPKRCLDQPDVMLGRQPVQTPDLVAAVLKYVRDELQRHFNGSDPDELWLTHPARWEAGDPRMRRLESAAGQAGFPPARLLPEPCAAALALAADGQLDEVREGELIAVYDLGGGTFDTALLSRDSSRGFVLLGEPGGDPELGGEWLDDRLFERLSGQLPAADEASLRDPDSSTDPLRWRRAGFAFRQGIRRAKERLARETSIQIALTPPFSLDHLTLSRAELERTATPLITKSADRFELFLQRNSKTPADLAAICLVGGSSRLTVVNRILGNRFERPIATHGDPKSVTALGALYELPAIAPAPAVVVVSDPPRVSVVRGTGPSGSAGRDQGGAADVLEVPGTGQPSASPDQAAGVGAADPVAEDVQPATLPAAAPVPAGAVPPGTAPPGDGATPPDATGGGTPPDTTTRKKPPTALLWGGAGVVLVAAIVVIIIVAMGSGPKPVTPLARILPLGTTSCQSQGQRVNGVTYTGATSVLYCNTSSGYPYYALQFDNDADYSAGLAKANAATGWNSVSATATTSCPSSTTAGKMPWHDQKFPATQGQFVECYEVQGNLWELLASPSERAFYVGAVSTLVIPSG
jgi:Hsp70 protein